MPTGKAIGAITSKITSIRVREINGEQRVIEATHEVEMSGQMSGMGTGTMTFTGLNDRGSVSDLGVGYLTSGDVVSAEGHGVYWLASPGHWEVRAAYLLGGQTVVLEGQIDLASRTLKGKMLELT